MSKARNKDEAKEIHVRYYDREPTKDTGHAVKLPMATSENFHNWNFKTIKIRNGIQSCEGQRTLNRFRIYEQTIEISQRSLDSRTLHHTFPTNEVFPI